MIREPGTVIRELTTENRQPRTDNREPKTEDREPETDNRKPTTENTKPLNHLKILENLPFAEPFLFVNELTGISEDGVSGTYTFPEDSYFYKGHFKGNPVTPGVILTECMAQIGVVPLGIFLLKDQNLQNLQVAMTNANVDYFLPVFPGEKVEVISEKIYFRFNKLKCNVKMFNAEGKLVCKGEISGMIKI